MLQVLPANNWPSTSGPAQTTCALRACALVHECAVLALHAFEVGRHAKLPDACCFRSMQGGKLPGARLQQRHHALRVVDLRDGQVQMLLERVHDALGLLRRQHRRPS